MSQGAKQSLPGNRTRTGIVGIESVLYGVDDVAVSTRFFTDFGLELLEQGQHGATFGTPERTSVRVRRNDDIDLPPPVEPGPTVREIVWGVENAAALEGIAADLSRDREVIRTEDGGIRTLDETGYTIGFRVTDRSPVFLEPQTLNTVGTVLRRNERFTFYDRATPQHIGHIVLYCPNYEEQIRFYTERLGFMVSDVVRGSGAFLRCSTDHHNLFLLNSPRKGLNHVSFGVHNIDEIMGGFKVLSEAGWKPTWGLGRHYIGSNLFYYFRNPSGGHVEYYADMDCITDPALWQPGEFDGDAPEALFAWGGYPLPDYRKSQWEIDQELAKRDIVDAHKIGQD